MQFVLTVTSKRSGTSTRCDVALDAPVVLGRHMESPILLHGEGLSRRHFALSLEAGTLSVQDLSSNGTWLNGIQLRSQTVVRLRPSDILEVPGYEVQIAPSPAAPAGNGFQSAMTSPDEEPPSPRARAWRAVTAILEPRELLLVGCILAVASLLLYASGG